MVMSPRKVPADVLNSTVKPIVVHITNAHCAFDDRIFYKELCSLQKKYKCYELTATDNEKKLTTMGGEKREPGEYNGVVCLAFDSKSKSFIKRCIRHYLPEFYSALNKKGLTKQIHLVLDKEGIYPDLIHFHDIGFAPVAIKLKKDLGCKLIFDSHEFFFSYAFNKGLSRRTCRKAERALLQWQKAINNSDYTIACTETMDNLISLIRQDDNHDIVYNSSMFKPETRKRSLDVGKKIVLIHEGSVPFNRGLRLMLEMFRDDYIKNHFQLKIVGALKGAEKKYFEEKCREYDLTEDDIYITGWLDYLEVPKALNGDIGIIFFDKVFNAFYSMPNKLYNYHIAGIPVIATHCADLSDTIDRLGTGVVVERSVLAVKEGLKELVEHYDIYQRRVLECQSLFHWSSDEKHLLDIYERVLKTDKEHF